MKDCTESDNNGDNPSNEKFCLCTHTLQFKLNELVEFVFISPNLIVGFHSVHLHGHSFALLGVEPVKFAIFSI
jgi:hypothetical protein